MRKSQTTAFLHLHCYIGKFKFYQKTYLKKLSLYCYIRIAVFSRGRLLDWRCSNTNANIDIHWFCNHHTSLQNTWQYARCFNADFNSNGLFFLFIYFRQVPSIQEKKYINFIIKIITKGIEILAKRLISFSIRVFSMKLLVILFIRKKKHLLGNIFGSPHTSNRIYLLRNCFSNYVYLKDMYLSLKGIGKILFVSVLRILLICKTLNFTAAFTKKIKVSKVCIQFFV